MTTSYFGDEYQPLRQERTVGFVTAIDDDGYFEVKELGGSGPSERWFPPEMLLPVEFERLKEGAKVIYTSEVALGPFGRRVGLDMIVLGEDPTQ